MAKKTKPPKKSNQDVDSLVAVILAGSRLGLTVKNLRKFARTVKQYSRESSPTSRLGTRSRNSAVNQMIWSTIVKVSKNKKQGSLCPECELARKRLTMDDTALFNSMYPDYSEPINEGEKTNEESKS